MGCNELTPFSINILLPIINGSWKKMSPQCHAGQLPKKQHEIAAVIEFVGKERTRLSFDSAVDIGGGMGHLARNLGAQTGLPIVSIDRNPCEIVELKALDGRLFATVLLNDQLHVTALLLDVATGQMQYLSSVYEPLPTQLTFVADATSRRLTARRALRVNAR